MTDRHTTEGGFTLIEVLIVTLLMGVIATAIAAAFIVIVRTAPETQARDDDARTLLGLTNYLPMDVSSTRGADIVIPGAPTSCGASDGTSLLSLSWTDDATGAATEVNYRFAQDSGWRIVRFLCLDGTTERKIRMSSILSDDGSVPIVVSGIVGDHDKNPATPDEQHGVQFDVTTLAGSVQQINALSDNLLQTLSPIPATSSTSTTTVPPANLPPDALDKDLDAWNSETIIVNLEATDPNGDALTATIDTANPLPLGWSASFTGLEMTLTPDPAAVDGPYTFGFEVSDTFGATDTALVNVTIVPTAASTTTSTTSSTTTTTTTIPCTVSSATLDHSTVSNGVHEDVARLKQDVTVTIAKSGTCVNLILSFVPDVNTATVRELSFSDGTEVTINKADYDWSDGDHVLEVRAGSGGSILRTVTLTVT